MNKKYFFKITNYLNAGHAIRWEDSTGQTHIHTWEIIAQISTFKQDAFPDYRFTAIEERLLRILEPFSQQELNLIPPFDKVNPTLENFTDHLFTEFDHALNELSCQLATLEVSESPTRSCVITRKDLE